LRQTHSRGVRHEQKPQREHAGVVGSGAFFGEEAGAADFAGEWLEVLQRVACASFGGVGGSGGIVDADEALGDGVQSVEDGLVAEAGSAACLHGFDGLPDEAGEFAPRDFAAAFGGFGKGEQRGGEQGAEAGAGG